MLTDSIVSSVHTNWSKPINHIRLLSKRTRIRLIQSKKSWYNTMEYCNFCKEEGLVEDSVAFCGKCRKYLCISCIKSHGKFLRDHVLSFGTEMPSKGAAESYRLCEIHTNQAVELFCEEH